VIGTVVTFAVMRSSDALEAEAEAQAAAADAALREPLTAGDEEAKDPVHLPPPTTEERNLALLAQGFGVAGYFAGFGQIVCPLVLWFVKRDESPFVAFHALQTALFHIALTVALVVVGVVGGILVFVGGIGLIVLAIGLPLLLVGGFILNVMGCFAAHRGEWSRYPLVGEWALPKAPAGAGMAA
jgi:uncharacterized Tic20 family protein